MRLIMQVLYKDIQEIDFLPMHGYYYTEEQLKIAKQLAESPKNLPAFEIIPRLLHGSYIFKDHSINNLLLIDCIHENNDLIGSEDYQHIHVVIDDKTKESELFYNYKNHDLSKCTFFEKAYFIALLNNEALCYQHKKLTQQELSKIIKEFGLKIPQSQISIFLYANEISAGFEKDIIYWNDKIGRNRIEELKAFEVKISNFSELLSKKSHEAKLIFRHMLHKYEEDILDNREKIFKLTEKALIKSWHLPKDFFLDKSA